MTWRFLGLANWKPGYGKRSAISPAELAWAGPAEHCRGRGDGNRCAKMPTRFILVGALMMVIILIPSGVGWAGMNLLGWVHRGGLVEEGTGYLTETFSYDETPVSPFQGSFSRQIGDTSLDVAYNFVFDDNNGVLEFETAHSLKHTEGQCCSVAFGGFTIQPTLDIEVAITGTMTYDIPTHEGMGADIGLEIEQIVGGTFSFHASEAHEGEGAGIFALDESVVVPAGEMYSIGYHFEMGSNPSCEEGMIGTATSDVTITIISVPEPASILLLSFGASVVVARRRLG